MVSNWEASYTRSEDIRSSGVSPPQKTHTDYSNNIPKEMRAEQRQSLYSVLFACLWWGGCYPPTGWHRRPTWSKFHPQLKEGQCFSKWVLWTKKKIERVYWRNWIFKSAINKYKHTHCLQRNPLVVECQPLTHLVPVTPHLYSARRKESDK